MHDMLKKVVYWALAGVIFGVSATLASIYVLKYWNNKSDYTDQDLVSSYIEGQEEGVGMSCADLLVVVKKYINDSVAPIIQAGDSGKDWLALVSDKMISDMEELEQKVITCHFTKRAVSRQGVTIEGDFTGPRDLLGTLVLHAKEHSIDKRSADNLDPDIFPQIKKYYASIK